MTHADCVKSAATWLSSKSYVVLPELYSYNEELADVIGFHDAWDGIVTHQRRIRTTLVECKVSRSDFLADAKKSFREHPIDGMGDWRYYCCPKGLIKENEVPEGWGLIYVYPSGVIREVKMALTFHNKNVGAEMHLLYYYARKARFAGVHKEIMAYRGNDRLSRDEGYNG